MRGQMQPIEETSRRPLGLLLQRESETKSARADCWRVAIESQTGLIHVVALGNNNQFRLIV